MNKQVNIAFNEKDITEAIIKLEKLNTELKNLGKDLVKEIAYDGLTYLDMQYANTPYQPNIDNIETSVEETMLGYSIIATGKDVVYEEFGTGDIGEQNSHPEKSEYPLNDYNSGETIRDVSNQSKKTKERLKKEGITSGKYWTYKKTDSKPIYTQGIPAGKQVFNTRNYIINEGIKKTTDKLVGDMLSKL